MWPHVTGICIAMSVANAMFVAYGMLHEAVAATVAVAGGSYR